MMGFEYILAYIKVATTLGFIIVTAIPFWLSWNCICPKYFTQWVPIVFHHIPYWHTIGLMIIIWVLSEQIGKITGIFPKLIYINIDNSSKSEGDN